ncbi:MAG: hypothetical protein A3H49_10255 [Nitrospirae bacterium RIFCSPLOWO2_02_FULL_62_14]|nr:MAG: hypothetical protein A3H49_10255 [Nitrospirae bacterium RIFCSPLOWO2_02_FULL_62_14]OGW70835.1 MAG: hypothetical protein A3A88_07390 [Nitrospirae bacterium RIFCSPLOWO2_01_FULL_62_17]
MDCPKCKGLMMLERFSDFFLIFYAWKCINCGSIVDRTITANKRKSLAELDQQPVPTRSLG